jgi:hypothetical protein
MSYPKFKYHKEFDPMVVLNAEEEKALGSGWEETPAAFERPPAPAVEMAPHVKKVMAMRKKKVVETKAAE